MSLKRIGLTGSLNNQPKVSARKFSSNRISLRRFPFPSAPVSVANYIEDVFSTYLYTGNGSGQNINNGIQLGTSTYGGSIYFDGTGDYLTFADNPSLELGSSDFTLEMWLYGDEYSLSGNYVPICKSGTTVYNPFLIYIDGSISNIALYIGDDSGAWLTAGSLNVTAIPNQWSHVAFCRSGNTIRAFLNGELVDTIAFSGAVPNNSRDWYIGSRNYASTTSQGYNGYISNLRLVVGTALYTASFTPSTSPLTPVANTQLLIGQSPSPTTDYSNNAFTATVVNAVTSTNGPFPSGVSDGGLVWIKSRSLGNTNHAFYDTARGATYELASALTISQNTEATGLTSFNSDGFSIGPLRQLNRNDSHFVSWTFRKQAKFFDIVTYTGNGDTNRNIPHSLGSTPGCIILKRTDSAQDWYVYHVGAPGSNNTRWGAKLNTTDMYEDLGVGNQLWGSILDINSSNFQVYGAGNALTNANGATYVAYLFANDAGGFGPTGTDNAISCGSYIGNGSATGTEVQLGYEPQWILIKNANSGSNPWYVFDNVRGVVFAGEDTHLNPNNASADFLLEALKFTSTGFQLTTTATAFNALSIYYMYIAIRRGPMRTPTSGTEVFQPIVYTGTNVDNRKVTTNILTDMIMARQRNSTSFSGMLVGDRLRGDQYLATSTTAAGVSDPDSLMTLTTGYGNSFSSMDGFGVGNDATSQLNASTVASNQIVEAFKRAPGFLDIVTYTGTGTARTVNHNLGVVPKMIWVKEISASGAWIVYTSALGPNLSLELDAGGAYSTLAILWNDTAPTSSLFTVGTSGDVNTSGSTYVAYIFGDVPSVSKCSYYVGKGVGTSQQIDCGFTAGARLVLIKSTEQSGNWYIYDSSRGILSGNDPYLALQTTNAENTSTDYIDPYSAGFEISSTAPADMNSAYGEFYASYPVGGTAVEGAIFNNNQFVAVDTSGQVNFSPDGIRWTTYASGINDLRGITFGNGLYVVCSTTGRILTSPNGTSWTSRTSGTTNNLLSCEYAFGKYWTCGNSGTLLSSPDGINWSSVTTGTTVTLGRIKYLNGVLFVVGSSSRLLTSSDGINFTLTDLGLGNTTLRDIAYGKNLYVIGGDSQTLLTSPDGTTWTSRTIGRSPQALVFTGDRFLAGGSSGTTAYSNDAITWTNGPTITAVTFNTAAIGNDIAILFNSQSCISSPRYIYWAIA